MKVATISLDIVWQDIKANLKRAEAFVIKAKADGCDVVVFPEVFNSGFIANMAKCCELPNCRTHQSLQQFSLNHLINIVAGFSEKSPNKKANNLALVFDHYGQEVARYSKLHPFNFANEGKYFAYGNETVTFEIADTKCAVFICYDLRFPEVFRQVAKDVEVIFVIANWPDSREKHWQSLLIARAIENQCFVVGVNRTGGDGTGLKFNGASMVIDPSGEVLLQTSQTSEYDTCDININEVAKVRKKFPFLDDMRFV
jgi:predicted amidohydrolase